VIQFYVGDGKGKTTAGIGLAVRALGAGKRVAFVQFDKGHEPGRERYFERRVLRGLEGMELFATGCERRRADGSFRADVTAEDRAEARRGLEILRRLLDEGKHEVVIADEILACVTTGILDQHDVEAILDLHGGREDAELVMTGRCSDQALIERADLVTEMRKVKHYFDAGVKARKGIEY
jgi:cob(I)alamin adenosyltransferase